MLLSLADNAEMRETPSPFHSATNVAGHILASGDFGGNVHLWDVRIVDGGSRVQVRNYRKFEAHKGHVVCLQLNARRIVTGV